MMPGSASGLRKTPCSAAPETASAPPTSAPSSTRGSRIAHRIASCCGSTSEPVATPRCASTIEIVSPGAMRTAPMPTPSSRAAPRSAALPTSAAAGRATAPGARELRRRLGAAAPVALGAALAELRMEATDQEPEGLPGPRAEAQQEQVVVVDDAACLTGRRLRHTRKPEQPVDAADRLESGREQEQNVRARRDQRFGAERLEPLDARPRRRRRGRRRPRSSRPRPSPCRRSSAPACRGGRGTRRAASRSSSRPRAARS